MRDANLPERIEAIVRAWPQWSVAERRRMDEVVTEVLEYCRSGKGNRFVASWCKRNLTTAIMAKWADEQF